MKLKNIQRYGCTAAYFCFNYSTAIEITPKLIFAEKSKLYMFVVVRGRHTQIFQYALRQCFFFFKFRML